MRRSGAVKRTSTGNKESSTFQNGNFSQLDTTEAGVNSIPFLNGKFHVSNDKPQSTSNGLHYATNGANAGSRKRKVRVKGRCSSIAMYRRRLKLHLRQKKTLVKQMLICGGAIFLIAFWTTLVVIARIQQQPDNTLQTIVPISSVMQLNKKINESVPRAQKHRNNNARNVKRKTAVFSSEIRQSMPAFDIVFKKLTTRGSTVGGTAIPIQLSEADDLEGEYADYGGLEMEFFEEEGAMRNIYHDYYADETRFRRRDKPQDDDVDAYYAFDDDYQKGHYTAYDEDGKLDDNKRCRRTSDHRLNFQTCNSAHELPLLESSIRYLGEGAYRQVMVIDSKFSNISEKLIVKDLHYAYDTQYDHYEYVRMDAIVAERLTKSPRIFDIYSFCGLSIISEFFPHGDLEEMAVLDGEGYRTKKEMHDEMHVNPQNNFTAIQKLTLATEMAEALVDLHGYPNGVIVHGDVQLSQYLYTSDMSKLKLNDFNRAEFMLWDDKNHEYCTYKNGFGHGNWRAPEEYFDAPLDEKLDVFSLGNNMYSLLTGLWPFYDEEDDEDMQERVKKGETACIDPRYRTRSVAEAKLVEAIEKCYVFHPEARASIFEVAIFLRQALSQVSATQVIIESH